jgi:integrase
MPGPSIYKRGGSEVWYYSFRVCGRRYQGTTGHREEGEARAEAQRLFEIATQTDQLKEALRDPGKGDPHAAFLQHIQDTRRIGRSPATWGNYARYADKFIQHFGKRCLSSLTKRDIEGWRDWLLSLDREDDERNNAARRKAVTEKRRPSEQLLSPRENRKYSPKYVSEHLNWLAAVFNHFGLPNIMRRVARPCLSPEAKQRALKYFTQDEMQKLFGNVGWEFRNTFVFLAYTGVRLGELHGLLNRPEDINVEEQIVWVTGKGRKRRPLMLQGPGQPAWDALQGEIRRRGAAVGQPVFNPYERGTDKRLRALCRSVGIMPRGPHALRHTFATHALLFWKWDISSVAKWLGHEAIDVTFRIYGHLIPSTPSRMWEPDWLQCNQDNERKINAIA